MKQYTDGYYCDGTAPKPIFRFALRDDVKNCREFLPTKATKGSAGWDVACAFDDHAAHVIQPGEYIKIPLGIRCILPNDYWLEMKPRSSSFVKKKLHALYGTIDQDYRQQLYFCAKYDGSEPITLSHGEKIGQIIPVKMEDMDIVDISNDMFDEIALQEDNDRRGGFGSTG